MHGWNIVYGLINFAILAVGLYLIGRKIVANAIRAHREKVSGDLEKSAASRENAKKLLDGIEGENAKGESEREEILRQARASVEDIHRAAREQEKKEIDKIALDAHKDLRRLAHHQRILVNQKAAGEITAAAAEQIARPENAAARERMTTQFNNTVYLPSGREAADHAGRFERHPQPGQPPPAHRQQRGAEGGRALPHPRRCGQGPGRHRRAAGDRTRDRDPRGPDRRRTGAAGRHRV